jgi:hypothetical protein
MSKFFDVIAINIKTNLIEIIANNKTEKNADAIEMMAISRRGVETHFYTTIPTGKYKSGDKWNN